MASPYDVAIHLTATNSVSSVLAVIAKDVLGVSASVKELEKGLSTMRLGVVGAVGAAAGVVLGEGLKKVVEAGGELVKQQALLANMGIDHAAVLETTAKAQEATHNVIGTTIAENIKGMRELLGIMPNLQEAQDRYVSVMRSAKVLESMTGAPADKTMQTLAKSVELRGGATNPETGKIDPDRFDKEITSATKAIVASGGLINADSLLQFMKTAGPAARMMSDSDQFYKTVMTSIMDMGGFRAGTAMTAFFRQFLGGKMAKPSAEEMQDLGILQKGQWHASGTGVVMNKGALVGEEMLKDPNLGAGSWIQSVLIPALRNHGITRNADIQQELYKLVGTETARRFIGLQIQNRSQIERDASLYDNALGDDPRSHFQNIITGATGGSYGNVAQGDLGANMNNLKAALDSLMQAMGAPMVPVAIGALQSLATAINNLAGGALAHPEALKVIGDGLAGLSVGLVALGSAAVLGAAAMLVPGGAVGAAIIGVGATVAALAAINWGSIGPAFTSIGTQMVAAIENIPSLVETAIESMASSVATEIASVFSDMLKAARRAVGLPDDAMTRKPLPPDIEAAVDAAYKSRMGSTGANEPSIQARTQSNVAAFTMPARPVTPTPGEGDLLSKAGSIPVNLPPIQVQTTPLPVTLRIEGDLAQLFRMIGSKIESEIKTMVGFGQGNDATAMPGHVGGVGHQ